MYLLRNRHIAHFFIISYVRSYTHHPLTMKRGAILHAEFFAEIVRGLILHTKSLSKKSGNKFRARYRSTQDCVRRFRARNLFFKFAATNLRRRSVWVGVAPRKAAEWCSLGRGCFAQSGGVVFLGSGLPHAKRRNGVPRLYGLPRCPQHRGSAGGTRTSTTAHCGGTHSCQKENPRL